MSYLIIKYSIPLAEFQVCSNFYVVLFNFRCAVFLFYQTHWEQTVRSQFDRFYHEFEVMKKYLVGAIKEAAKEGIKEGVKAYQQSEDLNNK